MSELEQQNRWKSHLKSVAVIVGIHSVLCMAIIALVLYFGKQINQTFTENLAQRETTEQ